MTFRTDKLCLTHVLSRALPSLDSHPITCAYPASDSSPYPKLHTCHRGCLPAVPISLQALTVRLTVALFLFSFFLLRFSAHRYNHLIHVMLSIPGPSGLRLADALHLHRYVGRHHTCITCTCCSVTSAYRWHGNGKGLRAIRHCSTSSCTRQINIYNRFRCATFVFMLLCSLNLCFHRLLKVAT